MFYNAVSFWSLKAVLIILRLVCQRPLLGAFFGAALSKKLMGESNKYLLWPLAWQSCDRWNSYFAKKAKKYWKPTLAQFFSLHYKITKITQIYEIIKHNQMIYDVPHLKSTLSEDAFTQIWTFLVNFLKKIFEKYQKKFVIILNYLPFTEDVAHHLNKLEFSSPSDALRVVRLKSAQWSRRR